VVAAARSYFLLPQDDERLDGLTGDGAAFVHEHPESQDVLLVDGYDAKRIVDDLASPEFYRACKAMLRPGGVAVFNLWGSDEYYPRYYDRLSRAFGEHVLQLPAEKKGNIIVFAFRKPLPRRGTAAPRPRGASPGGDARPGIRGLRQPACATGTPPRPTPSSFRRVSQPSARPLSKAPEGWENSHRLCIESRRP
jgi:hypothetical protein